GILDVAKTLVGKLRNVLGI
uniref:Uperin-2.8 n=1 Tax=Uperoleia mjobergii TaxID=104954 RepID=UPE28_UPEMJ|nr:RecName: Full=Uperin-2.8 [Uperoleia mjobergii]